MAATPVLVVAALEGMLGLFQFLALRAGPGAVQSATGTYPNRNHFAGLLEMALPLALAAAMAFWTGERKRWWGAAGMLAVVGLLVMGTVISLSRMGFLAALGGGWASFCWVAGGVWPRPRLWVPRWWWRLSSCRRMSGSDGLRRSRRRRTSPAIRARRSDVTRCR